MKYKDFEYNDCGVCLNPDVPYRFGKYNRHHFEIKVSETPRGWVYGYNWSHLTGGGGRGCNFNGRDVSLTRSKAIIASAELIKWFYHNDPKANKAIGELDRIIKVESGQRRAVKQMTIFDYLE